MKRLLSVLVLLVVPLVAHSPKSPELEYDIETGVLNVSITHSVNNASRHYVNKVVVELNGKKIIEQKFKSQINEEEQQVVYSIIDAKVGDKISVTAFCNISGKKKGELTISLPEGDEGSQ
jgi:desulfoferrodoxin (superoxide reductase-like protein)